MYMILDKTNKVVKEIKKEVVAQKYCEKRPYLRYEKFTLVEPECEEEDYNPGWCPIDMGGI